MNKAYIKAIEYYLPETILTNEELCQRYPNWTPESIFEKIGIKQRHVCDETQCASDLAMQAAGALFRNSALQPKDVDFVLFATQSPDYLLPTTACILQDKLGIPTMAGALDFNLGCSAYIYGLMVAKGLMAAGIAKNILFITAETYSKYIHPMDKSTKTLFGDGATATWISVDGFGEIGDVDFGTDGSGYSYLIIPAGGARLPRTTKTAKETTDEDGYTRSLDNLYMNGTEVFNFTIKRVPQTVNALLAKSGLTYDVISMYIFHQANTFMLSFLRKKLKIDKTRFYMDMEDVGNTVSCSIPIAMKRCMEKQVLPKQGSIMLVGFGVGLSWGSVIIKLE